MQLQDSLLRLADMTPEEQQAVAQRLVDELIAREKKEAEEAKREAAIAEREGQQAPGNKTIMMHLPEGFISNGDKSPYFYNAMTKSQGKTEFQRRWGARRLEDDWRRRSKSSFSFDTTEESEDSEENNSDSTEKPQEESGEEKDNDAKNASDPHNVGITCRRYPLTPEERKNANDIIQEGLYNMGLILKDKLEDYPAARTEFLRRRPLSRLYIRKRDVYYNLYLMAVRDGDTAQAEKMETKNPHRLPGIPLRTGNARSQLFRQPEANESDSGGDV